MCEAATTTDLDGLRSAIRAALTPDLLSPAQRARVGPGDPPSKGHCAVATEAAYHLLGGKGSGWVPVVLPRRVLGDTTHWWLRRAADGAIFDPTADQFPDGVPYHLGRGCGFQGRPGVPSKRARVVIERVRARSGEGGG